ncbi:MAG: putative tyrosine-protein kinase [Chthonomonadaceae bacterium]|nr:putative tyrosine-protein kinase [Chthonomonadaceae bacterium]
MRAWRRSALHAVTPDTGTQELLDTRHAALEAAADGALGSPPRPNCTRSCLGYRSERGPQHIKLSRRSAVPRVCGRGASSLSAPVPGEPDQLRLPAAAHPPTWHRPQRRLKSIARRSPKTSFWGTSAAACPNMGRCRWGILFRNPASGRLRNTRRGNVELRDYARLLQRRWRLVTLCTLLGLAAAAAVTFTSTKIYTSTTQLFVSANESAATSTDINGTYTGSLFVQQRVKSYTSVIGSPRVADLVRTDLGLSRSPEAIASEVSATAPLDTVLLNVSVKDRDPAVAQQIAASIGRVFPDLVDELEAPTGGGPSPVKVSVVKAPQLGLQTSPRPKLNLPLGLLVGLAIGVAGAFARETLDTSVKDPGQAAALTGAPVIGTINHDAQAAKSPLIVASGAGSPRSEAFRQLRTNLQFVNIDEPLRSLVITSSVPGEGKSTTTCNLGIALAEAGLRVIVVEADLRRPRVADYLGLEGAVGLTSVLLGRVSLDDALQPWGKERGLSVLASGPLPPNPSELLGSEGMLSLLHELEERADIVLFDAPPVLPVTDAAVLGAAASGVVLLVRSHKTSREQVARATQVLASAGTVPLGTVLNMIPTRGPDSMAYGYGYGYASSPNAATGRFSSEEAAIIPAAHAGPARLVNEPAPTTPAPARAVPVERERVSEDVEDLQAQSFWNR